MCPLGSFKYAVGPFRQSKIVLFYRTVNIVFPLSIWTEKLKPDSATKVLFDYNNTILIADSE